MIIRCPKCKTKFIMKDKTKEELLGKKVKCCSCDTLWNIDETSFFQEPQRQISIDIENDLKLNFDKVSAELEEPFIKEPDTEFDLKDEIFAEQEQEEKTSFKIDELITKELEKPKVSLKDFFKKYKMIFIIIGFLILYAIISFIIANKIFSPKVEEQNVSIALTKTEISLQESQPQIKAIGQIVNKTDDIYPIPKIEIWFMNEKDETLSIKTVEVDKKIIGPLSSVDFSFTFPYEDTNIKKVKVIFEAKDQK